VLKLRKWQSEAISEILRKYKQGYSHFLCLATPGAGKTLMASIVAKKLFQANQIDLVICFSPSINIANSLRNSLEKHIGHQINGRLGAKGHVMTYQSMLNLGEDYWQILSQHRVLVIFDEIHHCAGDDFGNGNSWGQKIVNSIQGRAHYTLALTGTPWRSDKIPIALSNYCVDGKVTCDYSYGLDRAIQDHVCRTPKIVAIDNEKISLQESGETTHYRSFESLLSETSCRYPQILDNTEVITQILKKASKKLNVLRKSHPNAGALVVAASIDHALKISEILQNLTGEKSSVVTYLHDNAQETIEQFRSSSDKWIVSVGMISEGTDIARLRVCCHLSRVKTELSFRQVLGRILRSSGKKDSAGYLFMPAEPNLIKYAKRVAEDVPNEHTASIDRMPTAASLTNDIPPEDVNGSIEQPYSGLQDNQIISIDFDSPLHSENIQSPCSDTGTYSSLSDTYNTTIGFFGRFKQKIIQPALSTITN
tara:strand:- start:2327 stop:3766 length:1440 start_codon:yes stop_codon:yes gene_type:complete